MSGRAKIAVVGTGIAGNVAAYELAKSHDVTVFEANDYVGGHSNTIVVPSPEGDLPLDTGFIVFNERTYPNFLRLLDELGVEAEKSNMSFSVRSDKSALEYNGSTLNTLFAQRRNLFRPAFHRMLKDIMRFNREAPDILDDDNPRLTLAEFLAYGRYSREFIYHYLIPMGAAIWSAEPGMMEQMPANFFVRFFHNHGLLQLKDRPQWYVVRYGSRTYVEQLVKGHRDRIRLSSPVEEIRRLPGHVLVKVRGQEPEAFDYVFVACHSDQALAMLADPEQAEREVLRAIPYQENEAILHMDTSLMPRRRLAWASWNYHIPANDLQRVTLTYHLNRLQGLGTRGQYFVSLNSDDLVRPDTVIRRIRYEHPVFTRDSVTAQARHAEINGLKRTYYCGAYWRYGFHEDGVVSAYNALRDFEARQDDAFGDLQRAS